MITAAHEQGDIVLTVSDDGIGMSQDQANRLLIDPSAGSQPGGLEGSFGLYNVNERIRYFSGNRYGLSIETEIGKGTLVTVRFKAVSSE